MSAKSTSLALRWRNARTAKVKRETTAKAKRELSAAEFRDFMRVRDAGTKPKAKRVVKVRGRKTKTRPLSIARRVSRKRPAKKHACCIAARVKTGRTVRTYYWTGRAFEDTKKAAKKYRTEKSAQTAMMNMAGRLPSSIHHLVVTKCAA